MQDEIFDKLKSSLLHLDPVWFTEKYLTLDGRPFRLTNNGYKPFSDIYRYIGIKALERGSKPIVIVKGRQVGATTMCAALEMYFMGSGLFGNEERSPIRIIHAFPQLDLAFAYSKTKLNPMISGSVTTETIGKKAAKAKSYMQGLLDQTSPTNDSLNFKQFVGGNHIWIESTGETGDRLRGRSADIIFFDECLTFETCIELDNGKIEIGKLYERYHAGHSFNVKSFNKNTKKFEYKKVVNAWEKGERDIIEITTEKRSVKSTLNHRFLTDKGYVYAGKLQLGDKLVSSLETELRSDTINDDCFPNYGYETVVGIEHLKNKQIVYDIEVEDNHNFIVTSGMNSKELGGIVASNCQDIPGQAIANSSKILAKAKYGRLGDGVQVFFGTPKQRGSDFFDMWSNSSQNYYHLRCEKCEEHFPLYTPGTDEWEKVWVHSFTVKCPKCNHEQDKVKATERGKWVPLKDPDECPFIGFHMSQLFIPDFSREKIEAEKPGKSQINTERAYQNEVLGEFYSGETGIMTPDDIRVKCSDAERKFRKHIGPSESHGVFIGVDIGGKSDFEQLVDSKKKQQGQSFSCIVVLSLTGPGRLSIEFASKFKRNDYASKKEYIDHYMRMYSANVTVCDIGYAGDFCEILQNEYGDRFLASSSLPKVNEHYRYNKEVFPRTIQFEKDYAIAEMYEQMKKGNIRFPYGDYEQINWLVQHCTSMEIKPTMSRTGEVNPHYIKGSHPNDGFMALINAYLAYKWYMSKGFTVKNPLLFNDPFSQKSKKSNIPLVLGYVPKMR